MTTTTRNRKAREDGDLGEAIALKWITDLSPSARVKVLNTLFDMVINDRYVEVKTCAEEISAPGKNPFRPGRFTLHPDQHLQLVKNDGFYLFVVLRIAKPPAIWLAAAKTVYYHRQIAWKCVYRVRSTLPTKIPEALV